MNLPTDAWHRHPRDLRGYGLHPPPGRGLHGNEFFAYLRDAFDVHDAEGADHPTLMSIGMHCRLLGRPRRMRALQRFLDHVQSHDRVWTARRIDIARHWKQVHPFDAKTAFVWE